LLSALFARDLNLMALGEEPAMHLGLDVEYVKKVFFLVASLMTGATVAACGLIGFVGLIVPHSVRLAIGPNHRQLVTASALAGAAFLVVADVVARTVIAPLEVPIGAITALLGGPFFLVLLKRRQPSGWN
jgi:iron complex transport system permease protein